MRSDPVAGGIPGAVQSLLYTLSSITPQRENRPVCPLPLPPAGFAYNLQDMRIHPALPAPGSNGRGTCTGARSHAPGPRRSGNSQMRVNHMESIVFRTMAAIIAIVAIAAAGAVSAQPNPSLHLCVAAEESAVWPGGGTGIPPDDRSAESVVTGSNRFACDLYRRLADDSESENLLFSPYTYRRPLRSPMRRPRLTAG